MINLLDIAPIDGHIRRPRIFPKIKVDADTIGSVPDTVVTNSSDTVVTDTINSGLGILPNTGSGSDDSTILIWALVVVFFALLACLYFVFSYRRRLGLNS